MQYRTAMSRVVCFMTHKTLIDLCQMYEACVYAAVSVVLIHCVSDVFRSASNVAC